MRFLLLIALIQDDVSGQVRRLAADFEHEDPRVRDRAAADIIQLAAEDYAAVRDALRSVKTGDPEVAARIDLALRRLPVLQVTIEVRRKKLRAGDEVLMVIRVKNISDGEVLLASGARRCIRGPLYRLEFTGDALKSPVVEEAPLPPAGIFEWGSEHLLRTHEFFTIPAGDTIEIGSAWDAPRYFKVPSLKPGTYTVRLVIDFTKAEAADAADQDKLDRLPQTPFASNQVDLEILND